MRRGRRALGVAVASGALVAGSLMGTGTAQAAEGCGGQIWATHGNLYWDIELRLYWEGQDTWCASARHVNGTYGTSYWTSVQLVRSDGVVSRQDEGNYRYYAGPVRLPMGQGSVRVSGWSPQTGLVSSLWWPHP